MGSNHHHLGEFLQNYYMSESVYDSDHDSVVRNFIGFPVSCEVSLITSSYMG